MTAIKPKTILLLLLGNCLYLFLSVEGESYVAKRYCREIKGGAGVGGVNQTTLVHGDTYTIYFRINRKSPAGRYRCVWNVKFLLPSDDPFGEVHVDFRRLRIRKRPLHFAGCVDQLSIFEPTSRDYHGPGELCSGKMNYKVNSNSVIINLEYEIPGDASTDDVTSFAAVVTSKLRTPLPTPFRCDERRFDSFSGTYTSPYYPNGMRPSVVCTGAISRRNLFLIKFNEFSATVSGNADKCSEAYVEFTNPKTAGSYGRMCATGDQGTAFLTTYFSVAVTLRTGSNLMDGRFSFNWTEVPSVVPVIPLQYEIDNEGGTWNAAQSFCKSRGATLCRKQEICPLVTPGYGIEGNWVAVLDRYNEWIGASSVSDKCRFYSEKNGPPSWGQQVCKSGECPVNRDKVFCCRYPSVPYPELVKLGYDLSGKIEPPIPVPVYVTSLKTEYGYAYQYSKTPITDDPHWIPVGRFDGDVASFDVQSCYSASFPDVIYFCWKSVTSDTATSKEGQDPINLRFSISQSPCARPWNYDFHGYVSKSSADGLKLLNVENSKYDGGSRVFTRSSDGSRFFGLDWFTIYVKGEIVEPNLPSSECGNRNYDAIEGTYTSPLYPDEMKPNMVCFGSIARRNIIRIVFTEFTATVSDGADKCSQAYVEFTNPKTGASYGRMCAGGKLGGSFVTTYFSVSVTLHTGNKLTGGRFSFTYLETTGSAVIPFEFMLDNKNATWNAANRLCRSKGYNLCRKSNLCPFVTPGYGIEGNWVAVRERKNEWVGGPSVSAKCSYYSDSGSSPDWGQQICVGDCPVKRSKVFCCSD